MNDNQEICDFVVQKMVQQNSQSIINGTCAYRGLENKKCAVGQLIDEEFYTPNLEGNIINNGLVREAVKNSCQKRGWNVDDSTLRMLNHMQNVHDSFGDSGHALVYEFGEYFVNETNRKFNAYSIPEKIRSVWTNI